MVFRCDIDLEKGEAKNVETLAWNFRNNYEVAVDSFGTMWQSDNDDDGNKGVRINYVMQYGNYGYSDEMTGAGWQTPRTNMETEIPKRHWHQNDPGMVPNLLQTGSGSPTGMQVNEGTLLGPEFFNQVIHCDAGPRVVRAYPVTKSGAGYTAEIVDILTSTDTWYRPADLGIAPDGSLFVADWYDQAWAGTTWAITRRGRSADASIGWRPRARGTRSRRRTYNSRRDARPRCSRRIAPRSTWPGRRWSRWGKARCRHCKSWPGRKIPASARAPWACWRICRREAIAALRKGLTDADANVRIAAIRFLTELAATGGLDPTPLLADNTLVRGLINDKEPQVRREIALSLHGGKDIARIWAQLATQHDGKDRWYLEALGIGATGSDEACFEGWLGAVGGEKGQWNTPAGRDIIWRLRTAKTLPFLAKIITDSATAKDEVPRYLRALDFHPASEEKTATLLRLAKVGSANEYVSGEALERLKNTI